MQENGAPVLVKTALHYFGAAGGGILGVIVIFACLTTSVGLAASCAAYFNLLLPKISSKTFVTVMVVVCFFVALFGLTTIIKNAVPVLLFLYPMSISLIALAFLHNFFNGRRCVYVWTTLFTAVPALCDGLHGFGLKLGAMEPMLTALPLAEYSMGWICFFAVGFAVGIVQMLVTGKKEQA